LHAFINKEIDYLEVEKMKTKSKLLIACSVLLLSILACNIPLSQGQSEFPPTPNATMTALFAQATLLTPSFVLQTETPQSPTQSSQTQATATEQNVVVMPSFTASSTLGVLPSHTPQPTATEEVTPERSAGSFKAAHLSSPPTIDGNWDEWTSTQFPANYVVYGGGNWEGKDDLASAFRIGWDNNNLYIAVKVVDDTYVQNASGANIYKGDSIELLIDTDLYNDFNSTELSSDDYQLGISPGNPKPGENTQAYLWYPSSSAGERISVEIKAIGGSGLYRVEAAIPWSVFNYTPSAGKHLGFQLSVSDNDKSNENTQQTMVSEIKTRKLTDPTAWAELVLGN
jgi:hypothetical protein